MDNNLSSAGGRRPLRSEIDVLNREIYPVMFTIRFQRRGPLGRIGLPRKSSPVCQGNLSWCSK